MQPFKYACVFDEYHIVWNMELMFKEGNALNITFGAVFIFVWPKNEVLVPCNINQRDPYNNITEYVLIKIMCHAVSLNNMSLMIFKCLVLWSKLCSFKTYNATQSWLGEEQNKPSPLTLTVA